MKYINEKLNNLVNTKSDINEHLLTLKKYAELSDTVVEMGVRGIISTWAFLAAKPKSLLSIDIHHPSIHGGDIQLVEKVSKENSIDFKFLKADTTKISINECDLLFIDTWHVYDQLKIELTLHGNKAKKYLIFHDTETFGTVGESKGYKGLNQAIEEFMEINTSWVVENKYTNNNGLTILRRVNND